MKAAFFLLVAAVAAQQYAPFVIDTMKTHQPNGVADGQVNYYNIEFDITSANGDFPESAYCWTLWGDNEGSFCGSNCVAYSTNVPTGSWITCAHNSSELGDQTSNYAFQLFPYFSIGNFSVQVQQNFSVGGASTIAQSAPYHITNRTSAYVCDMNPTEVSGVHQHASGDCQMAADASAIDIPVATASAACSHASTVAVSFPVTETTLWGETIFVIGNITELGDWDLASMVAINADEYTATDNLWNGSVDIAAGTAFEYKYVQQNLNGSYLWECGENRLFTVSDFTCGTETAGNNPDYFRCGRH